MSTFIRPSFWSAVRSRAWAKTLRVWPIHRPVLVLTGGPFVLGVIFKLIADGSIPATQTEVWATLRWGLGFVGVGLLLFGWSVYHSAEEVFDDQRDEMDRLEQALEAATRRAAVPGIGEQLIALRKSGYLMRNQQIRTEDFEVWRKEIDNWTGDVLSIMDAGGVSAADQSRFEVVGTPAPVTFLWAANGAHQKRLQKLEQQLQVLLEVMAKF